MSRDDRQRLSRARFPHNLLLYIFLAYLALGVVWFGVLNWQAPATLLGIEHDLEGGPP